MEYNSFDRCPQMQNETSPDDVTASRYRAPMKSILTHISRQFAAVLVALLAVWMLSCSKTPQSNGADNESTPPKDNAGAIAGHPSEPGTDLDKPSAVNTLLRVISWYYCFNGITDESNILCYTDGFVRCGNATCDIPVTQKEWDATVELISNAHTSPYKVIVPDDPNYKYVCSVRDMDGIPWSCEVSAGSDSTLVVRAVERKRRD